MGQCCASNVKKVQVDETSGLNVTITIVDKGKVCIKWHDIEGKFPPITVKYKHTFSDAYNYGQMARKDGVCYIGGLKMQHHYEFFVRPQLAPEGDAAYGKPIYVYTDVMESHKSRKSQDAVSGVDSAPPEEEDDRPKSAPLQTVIGDQASFNILQTQKSTVEDTKKSASFFAMKSDNKIEPSSSRIDWPTLEHPMGTDAASTKAPSPMEWPSKSNTMLPPLDTKPSDRSMK